MSKQEKRYEVEKRQIVKKIERRHLEESNVITSTTPAISLADLTKINPVDFKGRPLKNESLKMAEIQSKDSLKKNEEISIQNINSVRDAKIIDEVEDIFNQHLNKDEEHDLKEGEDIIINNNQF